MKKGLLHHRRVGFKILSFIHGSVMSIFLKFNELMIFIVVIKYHFSSRELMKSSQLSISVEGYDNEVFRTGKQGEKSHAGEAA